MNWSSWLLWGFVATVVMTTLRAGSQGMGMTRMNVPYLLGTMVTPNRDRAKLIGVFLHFINGWLPWSIVAAIWAALSVPGILGMLLDFNIYWVIATFAPALVIAAAIGGTPAV